MRTLIARSFAVTLLVLGGQVSAQVLPVSVVVAGQHVAVDVHGLQGGVIARLGLSFSGASSLTVAALGITARQVSPSDPDLLARLPSATLVLVPSALPVLVTVDPPVPGLLSFRRTYRYELGTHALPYVAGSRIRVFKAAQDGPFHDITDEIAPGSVRARGSSESFSEFLVVVDNRSTEHVAGQKRAHLRDAVAALPVAERPAFDALLDGIDARLEQADFAAALREIDALRQRAVELAGGALPDQWRSARDLVNHAGRLLALAATLRFSVAFWHEYG